MAEIFRTYKGICIKGYALPSTCGRRFIPAVVLSKLNGQRDKKFMASAHQLTLDEQDVATQLAIPYGEELVHAILSGVEPEKLL